MRLYCCLSLVLLAGPLSSAPAAQSVVASEQAAASAPRAPLPTFVSRGPDGDVTVRAHSLADPIVVDGRLDEPHYERLAPFDAFVQYEPQAGQPATEKTETWIMFDDSHVYIAARLFDSEPSRRVANEMRHDSSASSPRTDRALPPLRMSSSTRL